MDTYTLWSSQEQGQVPGNSQGPQELTLSSRVPLVCHILGNGS